MMRSKQEIRQLVNTEIVCGTLHAPTDASQATWDSANQILSLYCVVATALPDVHEEDSSSPVDVPIGVLEAVNEELPPRFYIEIEAEED